MWSKKDYDRHWKTAEFWPKVWLLVSSLVKLPMRLGKAGFVGALSATASTHFSVCGTALSHLKKFRIHWAPVLAWSAFVALSLAIALYPLRRRLSPDQGDVASTILAKLGFGILDGWADEVAGLSLEKWHEEQVAGKPVRYHTAGLLWLTCGRLSLKRKGVEHTIDRAVEFGEEAVLFQKEFSQAGRIYKEASILYRRLGEYRKAEEIRLRAVECFEAAGDADQLHKMGEKT